MTTPHLHDELQPSLRMETESRRQTVPGFRVEGSQGVAAMSAARVLLLTSSGLAGPEGLRKPSEQAMEGDHGRRAYK